MSLKRRIKRKSLIRKILDAVPGKNTFGIYRFLPAFVLVGAGLEYTMIHWEFKGHNFYKTFNRRQAQNILERERAAALAEKEAENEK